MSVTITMNQFPGFHFGGRAITVFGCIFAADSQPKEYPDSGMDDDAQTLAAIRGGDSDAFERVVEKYQSTISAQMYRFSRDPEVVEELTHDVFVQAFLSLKSYRAKASLLHWLRKIAVRVGYRFWTDRTRQQQLYVSAEEIKGGLDSLENGQITEGSEARDTLDGLLQLLQPRDRLVLTLLYWEGYSVAEAAKLAGWSQSMVKVQAHRARKRLRKKIEESLA